MRKITWHLYKQGLLSKGEGSSSNEQLKFFTGIISQMDAPLIGEIGFNWGLSSYIFLEANPKAKVISFDIGKWEYVLPAKKYIDEKFPGRLTLVIGDSRSTVSSFHKNNLETVFDLVFIDGGHEYEVSKADLINMRALSDLNTKVVMDDIMPWSEAGKGPARAWEEMVSSGLIHQESLFKDGLEVKTISPPANRCWAVGSYIK